MDLTRERELLKVLKYGDSLMVVIPRWLCAELNVIRREYVYVRRAEGRSITYRFVEDFTRDRRRIPRGTARADR